MLLLQHCKKTWRWGGLAPPLGGTNRGPAKGSSPAVTWDEAGPPARHPLQAANREGPAWVPQPRLTAAGLHHSALHPHGPQKKALSSRGRGRLRVFLELRRPWGSSPEARRGSQGASRAAPGKSGLHARGEGPRGILKCNPEIPAFPGEENYPQLFMAVSGPPEVLSPGLQSAFCSRENLTHIPGSPGESGLVSRGSQGLRSPLESRRGSLGAP